MRISTETGIKTDVSDEQWENASKSILISFEWGSNANKQSQSVVTLARMLMQKDVHNIRNTFRLESEAKRESKRRKLLIYTHQSRFRRCSWSRMKPKIAIHRQPRLSIHGSSFVEKSGHARKPLSQMQVVGLIDSKSLVAKSQNSHLHLAIPEPIIISGHFVQIPSKSTLKPAAIRSSYHISECILCEDVWFGSSV
jgi:hypothetical protein